MLLLAVVVGLVDGTQRLSDNSMLVHLTTGIGIINSHHVPHVDPYSFTAHGDPWIVQSWLPEVIYGGLWKLGGGYLFVAFDMVLYAVIAGLIVWLGKTGNWIRTGLVMAVTLCLGIPQWSARPTAFGMLFLLITVIVIEKRKNSLWLLLVGLLWVNSHGTWPLGLAYIALVLIGTAFDRKPYRWMFEHFAALGAGVVIGGLFSPAGWRILTFPLVPFGSRSNAFGYIAEWQAPSFKLHDVANGLLVWVSLLVLFVIFSRRRPGWADLLPAVVFLGASLTGLRNLSMLAIVIAPALGRALENHVSDTPPEGKRFYVSSSAGLVGWALAALLLLVAVGESAMVGTKPAFNFRSYPVDGVNWLAAQGISGKDHRVYAPDFVGCYFIFRYGRNANVFIDDRYDMYPATVANDSLTLGELSGNPRPIFQRYDFDAVLVPRDAKLARYLDDNTEWHQSWADKKWQIFMPNPGAAI